MAWSPQLDYRTEGGLVRGARSFLFLGTHVPALKAHKKRPTADADHCRTLKAIGSAEDSCCALDRLQWVGNGLTLTTADDYNSKVLSERGGAGQRVGYTKTGLRASPNRITQNHEARSRHNIEPRTREPSRRRSRRVGTRNFPNFFPNL